MKIIIVDRDRLASQLLQHRLEAEGHEVVVEPVRKTAFDLLEQEHIDVVIVDPAPLPSARQITLPLRWEQRPNYLYLIQLGHDMDREEVIRCGLNDLIEKPFDWTDVHTKIGNAQRLTQFMRHLRQDDGSQYGNEAVFGRRAFSKLVLSALDRTCRYGEQGFLLTITIDNLEAIAEAGGEEVARNIVHMTETYLSKLHRLSDFLGRTEVNEYTLLLLRPGVNTEPQDAAERFAIALREFQTQFSGMLPEFTVVLWELPSAQIVSKNEIKVSS